MRRAQRSDGVYAHKLLACLRKLKPMIYADQSVRAIVGDLFADLGFTGSDFLYDPCASASHSTEAVR